MKHASYNMKPGKAALMFGCIAALWFAFDRITKIWADIGEPGVVLVDDMAGLFEFRLVHNTGAAWGIFGDSTFALGVFSCIVCLAILLYVFVLRRARPLKSELVPLAFVFSGGLGNAFDRLTLGYVVDFINCTFIDFPVFNVADIGVTCGIILFVAGIFLFGNRDASLRTGGR